ncbi:hypothetical protein EK904_011912, partial [Melospiza melodia maxima]
MTGQWNSITSSKTADNRSWGQGICMNVTISGMPRDFSGIDKKKGREALWRSLEGSCISVSPGSAPVAGVTVSAAPSAKPLVLLLPLCTVSPGSPREPQGCCVTEKGEENKGQQDTHREIAELFWRLETPSIFNMRPEED